MPDNEDRSGAPDEMIEISRPQAVSPAEMVECGSCGRKSPPNRTACLYCGAAIDVPEDLRARIWPVLKRAETWEQGFSVLIEGTDDPPVEEIADGLALEAEVIRQILGAGEPLPVSRTATKSDSEALETRLSAAGVPVHIVSDADLRMADPQVRLRSIAIEDGKLVPSAFNRETDLETFEPSLIVDGYINRKLLESKEARKQRGGGVVDSVEMSADEVVIDIYGAGSMTGVRIRTDGFDFSCLGERKAFTAAENIRSLLVFLRENFPAADIASQYRSVRHLLGIAWPVSETASSEGVERRSFGGYTKKRTYRSDNEEQFLRYSRLKQFLATNRK